MGHGASRLARWPDIKASVEEFIGSDSGNNAPTEKEETWPLDDEDRIKELLVSYAVDPGSFESEEPKEDVRKCLIAVSSPKFWPKYSRIHPQYARVKMWQVVHEKYRSYLRALVSDATAKKGKPEAIEVADVKKWKAQHDKIAKKIHSHSIFEDTQLFKFFKENVPSTQGGVAALENEHKDLVIEKSTSESLTKLLGVLTGALLATDGQDTSLAEAVELVMKNIEEYQDTVLKHLAHEEELLIGPWLALNDELYANYRTYLSWMYAPMY